MPKEVSNLKRGYCRLLALGMDWDEKWVSLPTSKAIPVADSCSCSMDDTLWHKLGFVPQDH